MRNKMIIEHGPSPWFNAEVIECLSSLLKPDWTILETGCGRSTLWYSKRVEWVHSFEHDEAWFHKTLNLLNKEKVCNAILYLQEDYPINGIPAFWERDEFDFISIDGRGRVKSVETVIPYLKSGGYLLLDDSQRPRYHVVQLLLSNWERKVYGKNRKKSIIWRKP